MLLEHAPWARHAVDGAVLPQSTEIRYQLDHTTRVEALQMRQSALAVCQYNPMHPRQAQAEFMIAGVRPTLSLA